MYPEASAYASQMPWSLNRGLGAPRLGRALSIKVARAVPAISSVGEKLVRAAFKSEDPQFTYKKWAATYDEDSAALGFDSPRTCVEHVLMHWPRKPDGPVHALPR